MDAEPTFLPLTAEQAEAACQALRLPPAARKLIRLGCVEGATLDEIAGALDLTPDQVVGLRDDLTADLEKAVEEQPEQESFRRILLSFFRGSGKRDHPPHSAANKYTGELEEVALRSPLLNEDDLGNYAEDWRTEPVDILGRCPGRAGRWRQEAPAKRKGRRA